MSDASPEYGVVLFHAVQGALAAERLLVAGDVPHKLIPVPTHLSSNCGFCIRFLWADRALVSLALEGHDLRIETIRHW